MRKTKINNQTVYSKNPMYINMNEEESKKNLEKEYNYYKLLKDIKMAYDKNLSRLEIPFSIIKEYPIEMPNKLTHIGLKVDFTNSTLLIIIPESLNDLNIP
jgi:hypothetical protein